MSNQIPAYGSLKVISILLTGTFGFLAAVGVFNVVSSIMMLVLPDLSVDLEGGDSMHIGMIGTGLLSLLELPVRLATVVIFLVWVNRAYKNLIAFDISPLEFSPGWAVGWWFIPFANLWVPFKVMRELWNASNPDVDPDFAYLNLDAGAPVSMVFWWITFLGGNFSGRLLDALIDANGRTGEGFEIVLFLYGAMTAVSASLALLIVRRITARHENRSVRSGESEPPAPPQFGIAGQ
jgi:hypothetical protein